MTNEGSNNVTKLRASDGNTLGTFVVGPGPTAAAFDGTSIWVTISGSASVTKLRASDGAVLGTFGLGTNPFGVAFDGANIWVSNLFSHTVTKLRVTDGKVLGTFAARASPVGVGLTGLTSGWQITAVTRFPNYSTTVGTALYRVRKSQRLCRLALRPDPSRWVTPSGTLTSNVNFQVLP